jgi:hypothetical protein
MARRSIFQAAMDLDATLKEVFENTRILRRPVNGIVTGFHELPYRIAGPLDGASVRISGTILVSRRLVWTMRQVAEHFGQVFEGDEGFMDEEIVGRSFQFAVARDPSKGIRNEHLRIERRSESFEELIDGMEDELAKSEDTRTGLISCPSPRHYPVSVDRFIREILPREFG